MRFPTGSEVTRLRTRYGQRSKVYLGVQRGKERTSDCGSVFNVGCHYQIVVADAYDNDDFYLDFNVITLVGSDIRPGMTLAVGTLADPFLYGSARIRVVDAANQRLYLEPNNLNDEGYFVPGNYVHVDGVYRLYRILPYIEAGTVYEDGNADSLEPGAPSPDHGITWNANYYNRPVALMGSPRPAWVGEAIDFYGWRSHGRDGRIIQNWTWDFDSGVCEGPGIGFPGSPASPIWARWDTTGEYVASLVVEDDSGNAGTDIYGIQFNRHRAVRPTLVFDRPGRGPNPPYTDFEVSSLTGRYGSGWSCRITVFGTADKAEFPDNAMIILWAEDWHGGERGSIGGWYGQENILFVGHIRADSVEVDSEKSAVSFEANTIEQWMKETDVWPANFVDNGAQNAWHEFDDMTIEDCLWHLAEVHSNLKDVTDCFFASDVNAEKDVDFLDLTEASLYDQMSSQIGSCFFGQLSASRHGSIHLFKHKNMMDLWERAWWGPPVYSFNRQDWRDELQIGEERQRDSVAQVDFIGFVYDANGNPLESYSLAPERQTNFGMIEKVSGILLSGNTVGPGTPSQAESDTLAGLYRAWKNIRFPHVRVPAVNNRILEPATLDYFAIVLAEADTVRGYDWPGKEFLTTGISVRFDPEKGTILTEVEGEASTWGPDGVAGPYPSGPPSDNPPADNPPEYWPDWPPGVTPDGDLPPWVPESVAPIGCSWTEEQNTGLADQVIRCVWFNGYVFAFTLDEGVWRRDGVGPWTRTFTGPLLGDGGQAWYWEQDGALYCGDAWNIYRSTDGVAWNLDVNLNTFFGVQGSYDSHSQIGAYGSYLYLSNYDVTGPSTYFYRRDLLGNWTVFGVPHAGVEGANGKGTIGFDGRVYWANSSHVRYWDGAAWAAEISLDGDCGYAAYMSVIDNILYIGSSAGRSLGGGYYYRAIGDAGWSSVGSLVPDNTWSIGALSEGADGEAYAICLDGTEVRFLRKDDSTIVALLPVGTLASGGLYGATIADSEGTFRLATRSGGTVRFFNCTT